MTDLDIYQPAAGIGQYQAGIVMTPEQAKALDEQVRHCTKAVLREGTDYGHIPGTSGDEKTLYRPGAQKLLQWFRLEYTCERVDVERDDDGRKHGITYRAEVGRRPPDGTPDILATCEGTADYDESKFYQDAEAGEGQGSGTPSTSGRRKYRRVPNADRWNSAKEYRADWNALMKRAQKRAIVGAVVDATAAGGIFTDREEDDHAPVPQDDGPSWYEQALEAALRLHRHGTDGDCRTLFVEAAEAHKDGLMQPQAARPHPEHRQEARRAAEEGHRRGRGGRPRQRRRARPRRRRRLTGTRSDDTLPVEAPGLAEAVKPGTGTPKGK